MTSIEFITVLSETYNEPMVKDDKPNLKLKFIKAWLDKLTDASLDNMLEAVIKRFIPTSTVPCPLIPHIIEICEIDTTEKNRLELAKTVADRVIYAVLNIGFRQAGCRQKAEQYIGNLGWEIIANMYGSWQTTCEIIEDESIEVTRSHIRDSVVAYIHRIGKGLENSAPELSDLNVRANKDVRGLISELAGKKQISL